MTEELGVRKLKAQAFLKAGEVKEITVELTEIFTSNGLTLNHIEWKLMDR